MGSLDEPVGSERAARLAARLRDVGAALIDVIARTEPEDWSRSSGPGIWSIGKDAEHAIEAAAYHQWIVRRTIGDGVPARRPVLERARLTTELSPDDAIALLQARTGEGVALLVRLTDDQLDLPARPPRARSQRLAETIEAVLIAHYDGHRHDIEGKKRR